MTDSTELPTSSGVYRIRHIDSGRCYIGSTVNLRARWRLHLFDLRRGTHRNSYLQRVWDKYGADPFVFEIIELVTPDCLIEHEQRQIDTHRPEFNAAPVAGSVRGLKWSAESRARITEYRRRPEIREAMSRANKGRVHTPETRANMSAAHRGFTPSPEHRAKLSAAKQGKALPPETRANMSKGQKARGLKLTPEDIARLSAARTAAYARRRAEREALSQKAI